MLRVDQHIARSGCSNPPNKGDHNEMQQVELSPCNSISALDVPDTEHYCILQKRCSGR